jgi:signal peptidase II
MRNSRLKNTFYYIVIALVITIFFSLDRILKLLALKLGPNQIIKLLGNFFSFHFAANPFLAFSLPLGGLIINIPIILIIILLLIYIFYLLNKKEKNISEIILLIIIFIGAFSNLFDRLVYGYVIDYLELKYFTIFNLADVMISFGAIILIFKNLFKK